MLKSAPTWAPGAGIFTGATDLLGIPKTPRAGAVPTRRRRRRSVAVPTPTPLPRAHRPFRTFVSPHAETVSERISARPSLLAAVRPVGPLGQTPNPVPRHRVRASGSEGEWGYAACHG